MTNEELEQSIRLAYSKAISSIPGFREAIEKNIIDGEPIPQAILDERDRLKEVCRLEILEYKQNNDNI